MKKHDEIVKILRSHTDELLQRYGITNIALFGSVVRGESTEKSDIDILADIPLSLNFIDLMGAELYLCDLLDANIDLIPRGEIRRELLERILSEAVAV